ncbi:hypothetical protein [Candidatus Spongiihabitans sp.]|uniref:hypothetical protein n=1 Tax=Candidatus Spongiihabitans sp. TaxID=3101308 RepID=UPI003C6F0423
MNSSYDSSHIRSKGYGQNAGYRGDTNNEKSASVDIGNSGSERSIILVVNIIDPKTNTVVGTEGFDLKFYSNSKTARFRVAIDDYYYGFSNTDVKVETVHAAQQLATPKLLPAPQTLAAPEELAAENSSTQTTPSNITEPAVADKATPNQYKVKLSLQMWSL